MICRTKIRMISTITIMSEICMICGKKTMSVIQMDDGPVCYSCYAKKGKNGNRRHDNEEARMQAEFFRKVPFLFPRLPDKLLFAVPNGGSRHKIEAANMKRQGVKAGVALNPATPLEMISEILSETDLVLIMSVNPGFGGQKFIESSVDKIRRLKALREKTSK